MLASSQQIRILLFLFATAAPLHAQSNARFEPVIDSLARPNEPGGVVLITSKGNIIYQRAFGLANVELNVPMQTSSVFAIASMTKQFTAVAILQQVEKGAIALTDTVGKFAPALPAALKGITIDQLLTHTGGVPAPQSIAALLAVGRGWLSAEQVIGVFKDQPLDFPPGSRSVYSNTGYQLLGYVLEKVTNQPLPEFIEATLLKPAGMNQSFWGNDMKIVANRAAPYVYTRNGLENAVNANPQIAWAAGALYSTAEDFLKWHRALLRGAFIKQSTLEKAWTPAKLPDGTVTDYGYGWFVGKLQGSRLVEHGGNMGGYMSHAIYLRDEDVLVEVFMNSRGRRLPELVATDLAAIALGRPLNIKAVTVAHDMLQLYAGKYRNQRNEDINVTVENGKLYYQKVGGPKWGLTPYAPDKFVFDNTSTIGEFRRDRKGVIVELAMETLRGQSKNVVVRVP
jgi:CubicO group peptidase (beta-lactamase class C family)